MKTILPLLLVTSWLVSIAAYAEKPDWAGSGKPTAEQKEAHKAAMNAKEDDLEDDFDLGDDNDDLLDLDDVKTKPGLEKQHAKKAEQEQKELGKGSEQGQESREQRNKWWQFWE